MICLFICFFFSNSKHYYPTVVDQIFSYQNLSLFLLQGENVTKQDYLTLEEGMNTSKVVVHETKNVNKLLIDNDSDKYVFLMSGEIVKGGQQDRTISEDLILKPKSKNVSIDVFCVESGRWNSRGSESSHRFTSSGSTLSDRSLKFSSRYSSSQHEVWQNVQTFQRKSGEELKFETRSFESPSSLQLTLENTKVKEEVAKYFETLSPAFSNTSNVLGFAFCGYGQISTVEYFGNTFLFSRLQKKLLESAAHEVIAQHQSASALNCSLLDVQLFFEESEAGTEKQKQIGEDLQLYQKETDQSVKFSFFHTTESENPLHVSIYSKRDISLFNSRRSSSFENRDFSQPFDL